MFKHNIRSFAPLLNTCRALCEHVRFDVVARVATV